MSAEIVALLVLIGGIVAAVVFTFVIVVVVDPSDASPWSEDQEETDQEPGGERS